MKHFLHKGLILILIVGIASLSFFPLQVQATQSTSGKKININTASLSELQQLPRIGSKVAQRIIDFRKEHGNFKKIEEIMKVRGIGEKTFNLIKDLITVGESSGKK